MEEAQYSENRLKKKPKFNYMRNNQVILASVEDLKNQSFNIPDYQRGYRWGQQEVEDLLNDIWEFCNNNNGGIYCIQPLVIKGIPKEGVIYDIRDMFNRQYLPSLEDINEKLRIDRWEVIDGQQRLTTINLILTYLGYTWYDIDYKTRSGSEEFLRNIKTKSEKEAGKNIDFFHMLNAYNLIKEWFCSHCTTEEKLDLFKNVLLKKVQFIWYETTEDKPIKVFTRLNIGKISLTDSELIKALFLNRTYYENSYKITSHQLEIASEWDEIEYSLQNEQMWLFINNTNSDNNTHTHIDYILEIIRDMDDLELRKILNRDKTRSLHEISNKYIKEDMDWWNEQIGHDNHRTFRYFYRFFQESKKNIDRKWMLDTWQKVKQYHRMFTEWYEDLELYHYVGFLILQGKQIFEIINIWHESVSKEDFLEKIKKQIRGTLLECNDINKVYNDNSKTKCRPLLILYNIQSIINKNEELINSPKYEIGAFYKFPFHIFKKEATNGRRYGWEIEHIASNADDIDDTKNRKMYLVSARAGVSESLRKRIDAFNADAGNKTDTSNKTDNEWAELKDEICKELQEDTSFWNVDNKNKIWNYTLLDSGTNKEYHNSVFPFKRMCVLSKERGYQTLAQRNNEGNIIIVEKKSTAFVPPCTHNVFTKAYTKSPKTLNSWNQNDAFYYLIDIEQTLKQFLYPDYYEATMGLTQKEKDKLKKIEKERTIYAIIRDEIEKKNEKGKKLYSNINEAITAILSEPVKSESFI